MAGTDWATRDPVATELLKNGHRFSFFEAVRVLQGLHRDAPRLGHQGPAERERVRLRPSLDMSFPTSDVQTVREIEAADGTPRYVIDVAFMGLYGTSSPLPNHYTEDLVRREEDDSLLRGFLDLFHHRLLSLFYRTWVKYRHAVQYDSAGKDYFSTRLLSLIGCALELLPEGREVPVSRLLSYAGLVTQLPRSAESFRAMLQAHYPESPIAIEQCTGGWSAIPEDQRNRIGGLNCTLGLNAIIGGEVYDRAGGFEVKMGPLHLDDYLGMLPGESDQEQLQELADLLNGDGLDYELTLTLRGDEVPQAQLDSPKTRLGWCSWLGETRGEDRSVTFRFRGWKHGRG